MSNYNPNIPPTTDDNPWADPARDNLRPPQGGYQQQQQQNLNPYQQSNSPNPWQLNQGQDSSYAPPPGPPPGQSSYQPQQNSYSQQSDPWSQQQHPDHNNNPFAQQQQHQYTPQQGGLAKAPTFNENDFVPADERGEQREAIGMLQEHDLAVDEVVAIVASAGHRERQVQLCRRLDAEGGGHVSSPR